MIIRPMTLEVEISSILTPSKSAAIIYISLIMIEKSLNFFPN